MWENVLNELQYLISMLLSVVLGFAIGFERKLRFKEAGIRTHTIVCAGSALIMVVSKYGFGDSIEADASRVAAQIVSGIGFLGAGIIIYRKHEIHGLTTAAGVWATYGRRRAWVWLRVRDCMLWRRGQPLSLSPCNACSI